MSLKLTDKVAVNVAGSGNKLRYFPVSDFNDLISSEESGLLDRTAALEEAQQTAVDGAPVAPVASQAITGATENWEITWTAVTAGTAGNDLSIEIVNGIGEDKPIEITVEGSKITVSLATDSEGDPDDAENKASAVVAAVNRDEVAKLMVEGNLTGIGGLCAIEAETNFEGGIDGTVGKAGELRYGDTALYVSKGISTVAVSNWQTISYNAE